MKKILLGLIGLLFAVPAVATDLPAGYTELEYIESTGTQYIDTGVHLLFGDEFYFDYMKLDSVSTENKGYGAGSDLNNNITGGGRKSSSNNVMMYICYRNTNYSPSLLFTESLTQRYVEHWKITTERLDSTLTNVNTQASYTLTSNSDALSSSYDSGNNLFLFRDNSAQYQYPSAQRVYGTWLKRIDGNFAFNLVPAKRNSDGVVGMYDTVSGNFLTNAGTGEFIAGPEVSIRIATTAYNSARFSPVVTELNDTIATIRSVVTNTINQTKAIADLQATKQTRPDENCPAGKKCLLVEDDAGQPHWYEIIENAYGLPNGYTALEYIQSRGAQYINTGIYATQNTAIETRFINLNSDSTTSILIGNGWTGGKYQLSIVAQTGAPNRIGGLTNALQNFWTTNTDFVVSMNKNGLYVNNSLKAWSGTLTEFNSNNANPLYLLGDPTASNRYTYAKLFYMKIYDDNVLWRNFVPAKRDSDGVIGLYDTVTYTFFTNAGTGTFIAGPEI